MAENFEKLHKDVLESIRGILAAENSAIKFFYETTYKDEKNTIILNEGKGVSEILTPDRKEGNRKVKNGKMRNAKTL